MTNTSIVTTALNHTNNLTMSSREIAELVESRHDSVKRTIVRLVEKNIIQLPPLVDVKNEQGQSVSEYQLTKRDSYVVVAQLSPEFTARLVDRWQELESQLSSNTLQLPNFEDPAEAAIAWAEEYRKNKALTEDVTRLQKTCNTLADQFAIGMTPCQFARQLNGVNIKKVNDTLYKQNWLYQQGCDWMVAAYARDKYLKQEMGEVKIREGVTRVCPKAVLTKKGAKALYKLYIDGKLPMKSDWDGHQTHILFSDVA